MLSNVESITKQVLDAAGRSYTAIVSGIATRRLEWVKSMEIRPHPRAAVRKVYHEVYQNQRDS
jgi:hypothetical protein